jgi:hypothetical protein
LLLSAVPIGEQPASAAEIEDARNNRRFMLASRAGRADTNR